MRKMIALAALAFAIPAHAADKGRPHATLDQVLLSAPRPVTCFVETSVAGTFLKADREAIAGIGGGCDAQLANLILGGGIRADWGDLKNTGSIFAKLGVSINNGAIVYGLAEWKVPEWKPAQAGQLAIGAGLEIKLDIINPNLSGFVEGTHSALKWGAGATVDDTNIRLGARYRF